MPTRMVQRPICQREQRVEIDKYRCFDSGGKAADAGQWAIPWPHSSGRKVNSLCT